MLLLAVILNTNMSMAQQLFKEVIDVTNDISLYESEEIVNLICLTTPLLFFL